MDDIDEIIGDIVKSQTEVPVVEKEKRVAVPEDKTSMLVIAEEIFRKADVNDKIADNIYNLFYDGLALGKDHSDASKDAILRTLEARIENAKLITELAKAVARKDSNKGTVGVGVSINTNSGSSYGIDLQNIKDEI